MAIRGKFMKLYRLSPVAFALLFLLIGCQQDDGQDASAEETEEEAPPIPVETSKPVRGDIYAIYTGTAPIEALAEATVIGKVGGEVHESIFHAYSNKAHDGYRGDSYIGRWCNLGAGTNTSNLKNDYGEVSVFDAVAGDFLPSGRQFAGLFMADHSKCSINTMFNTGTVVGVFCNLFGSGFPPRHIPSFSWGEPDVTYQFDKALRVAETVMARRGIVLTETDRALLSNVFERRR